MPKEYKYKEDREKNEVTWSRDPETDSLPILKNRHFEKVSPEQWKKDCQHPYEDIKLPKRATRFAAGYDFFSPYDFTLKPNEDIKIPTGIKVFMVQDECLKIYTRSGLGFKYYSRLANNVGIIDFDYVDNPTTEGHIYIKIRNEGNLPFSIKKGEAIAQGIFEKYLLVDGDDYEGEERSGGFGSTTK